MRSLDAGGEIFEKEIMVARMASQRKTISTNARVGLWRPKKKRDQRTLSANCPTKSAMAVLTSFRVNPFSYTRNIAIPIMANNVVHTGPNTHAGGLNEGLMISLYQPVIAGAVKSAPMLPAASQMRMEEKRRRARGRFIGMGVEKR